MRMNALPIIRLPGECQAFTFENPKEWADLRAATRNTQGDSSSQNLTSYFAGEGNGDPRRIRRRCLDIALRHFV